MTDRPTHAPEPWFANNPEYPGFLFHINNEWQVAIFEEPVDAIHTAACVNALAGLNPEAIPELIVACSSVVKWLPGCIPNEDIEKMETALDKVKP